MPSYGTPHLVTWTWLAANGLPEDCITNTFHFGGFAVDGDNIKDMLDDFYNVGEVGPAISEFFTTERLSGDWICEIYNLEDSKPRAAWYYKTGHQELTGGNALPSEVALVMSYKCERQSGIPPARQRNRIYLGGFKDASNHQGRPTDALIESVLFAGKNLLHAGFMSALHNMYVYSPTEDDSWIATNGFVNNAWDTQRRRGLDETERGVFTTITPEG